MRSVLFLHRFPYMVAGPFSPFYHFCAPVSRAPLSIFGQGFLFLAALFFLGILLFCQLHIMEVLSRWKHLQYISNCSNHFSLGAYYKIITSYEVKLFYMARLFSLLHEQNDALTTTTTEMRTLRYCV